jgi:hypothetical protein
MLLLRKIFGRIKEELSKPFRILRYEKIRDLQVFTNPVLLLGELKGVAAKYWECGLVMN